MKWALPHRTRRHEHSGAQNHTKSHLPCRFGRSTWTYLIWTGLQLLVISAFRSAPLRSGFACWADQICGEVHATSLCRAIDNVALHNPQADWLWLLQWDLVRPCYFPSLLLYYGVLWSLLVWIRIPEMHLPVQSRGSKRSVTRTWNATKQSLGGFGAILVILPVENPWFPQNGKIGSVFPKWGLSLKSSSEFRIIHRKTKAQASPTKICGIEFSAWNSRLLNGGFLQGSELDCHPTCQALWNNITFRPKRW